MKITKLKLLILTVVLMLSIFVANVANIIDVDSHALGKATNAGEAETRWSKPKKYNIDDSFDHLIWFLQVRPFFSISRVGLYALRLVLILYKF